MVDSLQDCQTGSSRYTIKRGGESRMNKIQGLNLSGTWKRLALILGLTLLYIAAFTPLVALIGPVGASLVVLPVVLTGGYFGVRAGLAAGLVGLALNTLLLSIFVDRNWGMWLINYWPGNLLVIGAGYISGRLQKELSTRVTIDVELHSRERFISMMGLAARDILDPKRPEDKYFYLATHLANLFVADYAYITFWDAAHGQMNLLISTKPLEKPLALIVLEPDKAIANSLVLRNRQALVMGAGPNLPRIVDLTTLTNLSLPAQSELAVPLIAGEYRFGVVTYGFDASHIFSREDLLYAQLVASQITLALWTAEQDIRIKKQLSEANALAKIEQALSETEQVGIETVLHLIVNSAKELIPEAEYAILHMVDNEKEVLIPRAVAGLDSQSKTTRLNMRLGEGIAGQVIATGEAIAISDVRTDSRFLNQTIPVKYRSLVVAPISGNEQVVGTISINSDQPNVFTARDSHLLGILGTQAAIAIENANLLETTRQDLKEMNILYQTSQELVASLDPDQLMMDVVNILQQSFGFYYIQIFVVDPQSGDLLAHIGNGEVAAKYKEQGYRIALGGGIVGHVAQVGEPFMTNNVDAVVFYNRDALLPDTQSELTAPIKAGNQVLGVLDIQEISSNRFTPRLLKLMNAVAEQLAVALQKANLYTELQTSLSQEKATRTQLMQSERLAVVGRLLASVAHELNNPLQAIQNALFLLREEEELSGQGKQDMEIILSETERMASLISRLRTTYRATQTDDFKEVDLNEVIEDVFALTATHMRHNKIIFTFHPDPKLPSIPAIPDQVRQVTLNLFMNAIEAIQTGGNFTVQTQNLADQAKVLITFTDTGIGISPEIFPRIFEPFVTDKETGTGLGLTITYDIIRQHQGDIQVENNPEGGATFKVWLPTRRSD
jgi:signal transduction histidine kinase